MTADVIAIVQWTVNTFHKLYADQGQSYILQLQRLIIWTALGSNYLSRYLTAICLEAAAVVEWCKAIALQNKGFWV